MKQVIKIIITMILLISLAILGQKKIASGALKTTLSNNLTIASILSVKSSYQLFYPDDINSEPLPLDSYVVQVPGGGGWAITPAALKDIPIQYSVGKSLSPVDSYGTTLRMVKEAFALRESQK